MPITTAEIAKNHMGDMAEAKRLIGLAKLAGFDNVKFQAYDRKLINPAHPNAPRYDVAHLTMDQLRELGEYAKENKIGLHCSVFNTSVILPLSFFTRIVKIPSTFMANDTMIRRCLDRFEEVHISTGFHDFSTFLKVARKYESEIKRIVYYSCRSEYPATSPRFWRIGEFVQKYGRAGYSDHSVGVDDCFYAHMLGADYIEKHFNDRKRKRTYETDITEWVCLSNKIKHVLGTSGEDSPTEEELRNFKLYSLEYIKSDD